jgi:hypothetical protein
MQSLFRSILNRDTIYCKNTEFVVLLQIDLRLIKTYIMSIYQKSFQLLCYGSLLILSSCGTADVEGDMKEWCSCWKEPKPDHQKSKLCMEMLEEINKKYEFNPEAGEIVVQRMMECK